MLGIDIGGSGIKAAPVDVTQGRLIEERIRVETPRPANLTIVTEAVATVARQFDVTGGVGVTFPGVVLGGVTRTAPNLDRSWRDAPAEKLFGSAVGAPVTVLNDADAAGIAEVSFGAGADQRGVVLVLTFGTGIGSALFVDGFLVPNTELGHLELDGAEAEHRASDRVREVEQLDWPVWAQRVRRFVSHVEDLLWPDLIIVGGGVSKKADRWLSFVDVRTRVVPALLQNNAGIIGAAMAAAHRER